jgi:hypothetical protein
MGWALAMACGRMQQMVDVECQQMVDVECQHKQV